VTKAEAQAYKNLGDYDFETEDYTRAFINYMISLDLYKNTQAKEFIAYLYNRLGCCKYRKLEYTEANSFFNRGWHYAIMYKDKTAEKGAIYNIAESYRNLDKYDSALEYIDKYLELCEKEKDFKEYAAANLLKANCLSLKQNKDKALSVYIQLMEGLKKEDTELLCNVYKAIGVIYLDEDNLDRSLEYFDKAEETVQESDKCTLFDCCIYKAKVYNKKLNFNEALSFANKALKISGELNDISLAKAAYSQLIEIYTGSGDFTSLKNNYIKLLDIIKNKEEYRDETIRLYNKLALHYLEQNDIEMCKKYLHMAS
jgi:tetratricopeptide (TPR) repeat protein